VVATGIDQDAAQLAASQEARLADLSNRIQAPPRGNAYAAAAVAAQESRAHAPVAQPQLRTQHAAQPVAAAPVAVLDPARASAAAAAIEAALDLPGPDLHEVQTQDPSVTITPYQPQPVQHYDEPELDPEPVLSPALQADAVPQHYVPPAPERPANIHRPRMPEISEFPAPAQRELRAAAPVEEHDEERRPMSLLRRIATVGLGRRDDEPAPVQAVQPPRLSQPAAPARQQPAQPVPQVRQQPTAGGNEFAKRSAPQQQGAAGRLDAQGRVAPQAARQNEDDQLEIPAFLRRQT
jgi:cell division protein FtsZ